MPEITTEWIYPDDFYFDKHTIITIDIKKFDKNWKDNPNYVGKKNGAVFPLKYDVWMNRHLSNKYAAKMSHIAVGNSGHKITVGFMDGRHRYSTYRDLGGKKLPVMIEIENLKKYRHIIKTFEVTNL